MTKRRIYGEDKPVMDWIRNHPSLPSYSINSGRTVNDIDFLVHQYLTTVDKQGTREIQMMLHIETKCFGGKPDFAQLDTLYKEHVMKKGMKTIDGKQVRHHGVAVLSMSSNRPEISDVLNWGRFTPRIKYVQITLDMLLDILTFKKDPDTLQAASYRRHHKTSAIYTIETAPLGFDFTAIKISKS